MTTSTFSEDMNISGPWLPTPAMSEDPAYVVNYPSTLVHLSDVVDPDLYTEMLTAGYVKTQFHPTLPLIILNYTAKTQFDRVWNDVTSVCRGLVIDGDGHVVARPFRKFFNVEEHTDTIPDGAVEVTDKLDGSLGILYPAGDGHAIATRGSFLSEQAVHATELWRTRYADSFLPNRDWTYLFEIIYPKNRIVVDYQGLDDLVLIGAVETATGRSVPLETARADWTGPVVEQFPFSSLHEALSAPARDGKEGVVCHFVDRDIRLKIKQADYVRLHRLVTGVSERRIWEMLSENQDLGPWLEAVPDEVYGFVARNRDRFLEEFNALSSEVETRYHKLITSLPAGWTRKEFAAAVNEMSSWPLARAMFLVLDNKPYDHLVWWQLRPAEHIPMFAASEDSN